MNIEFYLVPYIPQILCSCSVAYSEACQSTKIGFLQKYLTVFSFLKSPLVGEVISARCIRIYT